MRGAVHVPSGSGRAHTEPAHFELPQNLLEQPLPIKLTRYRMVS